MRILVVNPNTTASMTRKIGEAAVAAAASGTVIEAVNPAMGPASIEGYYDEAFAVPGLLAEIAAGEARGMDGVVVACFDDTGVDAARCLTGRPVVGICEAALHLAAMIATRCTIVTTLPRSVPPLAALVRRYGMAERCTVRAADVPVLALEGPASGAADRLRAEIGLAIREDGAECIVLGCAGMADLARGLSRDLGMPVIDGVAAGVKLIEALVGLGLSTAKGGGYATPLPKPYLGAMAPFRPK
ncbi:MAG TPA: aspartate/glutamate racemase family protein [Acetobacteraceae bacterium]|nr:aspartate/glutamate racemase family protein [Acetobacteraceae bacterium]